jgi:H2-forming N5,N10-methylenetetrahydromethanopterin dehydrogenase-like enzyme
MIKNDLVSCVPNYPSSSDDDLFENNIIKVCSFLQDHIQRAEIQVLSDRNGSPTIPTKRTFTEKMEGSFLVTLVTENTIVIFQKHVFSS